MRKLVIILVLIFLNIFSFGQMTFNGIPLGGPYHNFKLELQKKEFTYRFNTTKEAENIYSYTGKYIEKDVDLEVMVTPTTKTVWKVSIDLPAFNSWRDIKTEFNDLEKKMTLKYGPGYYGHITFLTPYIEGDGNELLAIAQNKCTYEYCWKNNNGTIIMKMVGHGEGAALINITYEDKNASDVNKAENDKIIMDGL
jgi:hypothetical protein